MKASLGGLFLATLGSLAIVAVAVIGPGQAVRRPAPEPAPQVVAPQVAAAAPPAIPTPAGQDPYRVAWVAHAVPADMPAEADWTVALAVTNAGSGTWSPLDGGTVGRVAVSYHWLPPRGTGTVIWDGARTPLPGEVGPGETATLTNVRILTPREPAEYRLQLTMIQEDATWFEQRGAATLTLPIRIVAPAPETSGRPAPTTITHGVASGDVTATGATVWARAGGPATLHVEYDVDPAMSSPVLGGQDAAIEANDFTARVRLQGLAPDTAYSYRAWFAAAGSGGASAVSESQTGRFRTAPDPAVSRPVGLVFSADLGGTPYCRHVERGYAIFDAMRELGPDLFVALGDSIYGDLPCAVDRPDGSRNVPGDFVGVADPSVDWTNEALVRDVYRRHWRYNRADPHLQAFLRDTPLSCQWDDHEVINDFGGSWTYGNAEQRDRAGYPHLVRAGRDALFAYCPMVRDPAEPDRIHRSSRWGRDLDLFLLDARSYRSRNDQPDEPGAGKTMLGAEQLAWLKDGLLTSTATWKVISSDVPLAIPTGSNSARFGRDGWANWVNADFSSQTGFERELGDLLRFLDDNRVRNVVVISADAHHAQIVRYAPDLNGDGDPLVFHEITVGPLSAGPGNPGPNGSTDPTFNPTPLYIEGQLFNFGYVRVQEQPDGLVHLLADVRGEDGAQRPGSLLDLVPR